MSKDWVKDIADMHLKFGVDRWTASKSIDRDFDSLKKFLQFRIGFLKEELAETEKALAEEDPEEIVDGLIDLCVVAIGTLDAFDVRAYEAWDKVHKANMSKEPGVKPERPNPLGLPDLIKPEGWQGPEHKDNHGSLPFIFQKHMGKKSEES